MGARPSAVDIGLYNLWAARHGQPRFGNHPPNVVVPEAAAAAPAAPAAPVPPVPPPRGWRRGRPRGLPPPVPHGALDPARQEAGDRWIRGDWENLNGSKTYARLATGRAFVIRRRNRAGEYTFTKKGEDYYQHNRQEFIIKIPVIAYREDARRGRVEAFVFHIPFTEDYIENLNGVEHELHGLFGIGRV